MPKVLASIGRFSARNRVVVVVGWIAVLVGLAAVLLTAPKTDSESAASIPDTPAAAALQTVQEKFPELSDASDGGAAFQLVIQRADGQAVAGAADDVGQLVAQAGDITGVTGVSNPLDQAAPYVSADQSTAVATISVDALADDQLESTYGQLLGVADDAPSDLLVEVGGAAPGEIAPHFGAGEVAGVAVAFIVLLLTFGSILAAGANMLVAISGVAIGAIGVLAYGALSPIQPTTITLATMLGLAVGIDYSLFILTRFRAELRAGRDVEDAIARATGTAGTAVVFAGLTVIIALVGLVVVGISFLTEMGVAAAFGVGVAVLMALTLLPVLLRTLGLRALSRKERDRSGQTAPVTARAGTSFFETWAAFLTRKPLTSIAAGVITLLVVAVPMLSMKTAQSVPGGLDPSASERRAYNIVVEKFGGVQSPLIVLMQGDDIPSHLAGVTAEIESYDAVQAVLAGQVNEAGDAGLLTVIPVGGPIDESTEELVAEIRDHADSVDGVRVDVTGETAIGIDMDDALNDALITYLIVIVALSFVLLTILFRSLVVPVVATVGFLLSVGASFGASVAVFQWGWLDPIIRAPQGDPMISILPIILVGVLFGLAMDYQVFLGTRIQEMYARGLSPKDSIVEGMKSSGPVLVAAAAIMAFVFAGFATSTMAVAASIAFGLVVGVLADAFVVRLVIMPAVLALLGRSAWWMPAWLAKILPDLDVEGHSLDAHRGAEGERDRELISR